MLTTNQYDHRYTVGMFIRWVPCFPAEISEVPWALRAAGARVETQVESRLVETKNTWGGPWPWGSPQK